MSKNVASANTVYRSETACAERAGFVSHFLREMLEIPVRWASERRLLVINTVQHFLVKLVPRDAVPSAHAVRKLCIFVKEDAQVPTIFQI